MVNKNPGLDEVMDDNALAAFTAGRRPEMEEPPERRWPLIGLAAVMGSVIGWLAGVVLAPHITIPVAILLAGVILTGAVMVAVLDRQGTP